MELAGYRLMRRPMIIPELDAVALAHSAKTFPGTRTVSLWQETDRQFGLVIVELSLPATYLHQYVCLKDGAEWIVWNEGSACTWLEIDNGQGVVSDVSTVVADISAVRLSKNDEYVDAPVVGGRLFRVIWWVGQNDDFEWPAVTALLTAQGWRQAAIPGVAATDDQLIEAYMRYEQHHDKADFWAWDAINTAADERPEEAWRILHLILARAANDEALLASIAAGPLEDLLQKHPGVGARIRAAALTDGAVSAAMRFVWD